MNRIKCKYEQQPPLYHYLTIEKLFLMISNNTFWFTPTKSMIDKNEITLFLNKLYKYSAKNNKEISKLVRKIIDNYNNNILTYYSLYPPCYNIYGIGEWHIDLNEHDVEGSYYLFCFSSQNPCMASDLWKNNNGTDRECCFEIDFTEFREELSNLYDAVVINNGLNIYRGRVLYLDNKNEEETTKLVLSFINDEYERNKIDGIRLNTINLITQICCIIKNKTNYEYEKEYREVLPYSPLFNFFARNIRYKDNHVEVKFFKISKLIKKCYLREKYLYKAYPLIKLLIESNVEIDCVKL